MNTKLENDNKPQTEAHSLAQQSIHPLIRPSAARRRRRTGKVARLPESIRLIVNTMLYNGSLYSQIVQRLAELGHPGFLEQNISRWRRAGYEDWLRDHQDSAELQRHTETLLELAKDPNSGVSMQNANDALIGIRLLQSLLRFDSKNTDGLASGDLSAFFKLARLTNDRSAEHTRRDQLDLARLKLQDLASEDDESLPAQSLTAEEVELLKIACNRLRQTLPRNASPSEPVRNPDPTNT